MLHMVNRMCWNSKGWRQPTHSMSDGGYPSMMGFGVEEWNFQLDDAVDGYVYGFLYYHPPEWRIKKVGNEFRIGFWSRDPDTRDKLIVGLYDGASTPTDDDYEMLHRVFLERGIYTRRANDLCSVVPTIDFGKAYDLVTRAVSERELSFKCPLDKVHYLEEYLPLEKVVPSKNIGWHFTKPTFVDELKLPNY